MTYIATLPLQVLVIAAFLAALTLLFIGLYLAPGLRFQVTIGRVLTRLRAIHKADDVDSGEVFADDKTLNHLWQEYKHTGGPPRSDMNGRGFWYRDVMNKLAIFWGLDAK